MNFLEGDLVALAKAGQFDVIVHGCNCWHTMGAGIAKKITSAFPAALKADKATIRGAPSKLGTYSRADVVLENAKTLSIINAYTQFNYGRKTRQVDYEALKEVLTKVAKDFPNQKIGMPRIGAGLAGGDWVMIQEIIQETLPDATVINYAPPS